MVAYTSAEKAPWLVPLTFAGMGLIVVMMKVLSDVSVPSALSEHDSPATAEARDPNGWDDEHCIGGGRHDMYTNDYEMQRGHLRLRWDCRNCPYWYLT